MSSFVALAAASWAPRLAGGLATQTVGAGRHYALGGHLFDAAVAGQAGLGGVDVASGLVMGGSGAQFVGSGPERGVPVGDVK